MTIQPILFYPDNRLRTQTKPITEFDLSLKEKVKNLYETMYEANGCGLAAPQVGLNARLFVMDFSNTADQPMCFINPKIINHEGERFENEGCLSFPGFYAKVKRAQKVTLRFFDEHGTDHEQTFTDLAAACCQHELQHLEGVLFIDLLSPLKRNLLLRRLKKQLRHSA